MKKILTLSLLAVLFNIQAQDKKIEKSFSNVKSVQISTSSGNISVKKGQGADVNVTLEYSYDDDDFTPVMELNNGTLVLKEEFTRGNHSGRASWTLMVPDNTAFDVNSGSGNIAISGLSADVKSNLGSGDVEISNAKGKMHFNTGSGDIHLTDAEGELSFNTGSGEIVGNRGTGAYAFNSGSGDIHLEGMSGTFEANTGSGNITGEDISLVGPGKFNTGSGDAEVAIAGNLHHSISVNSGSGDATLNFNGAPIDGEVIMTANERNGKIVAPFKFDKEETIRDQGSSPRIRKTAKLGNKDIQIKVGTGTGTAKITN